MSRCTVQRMALRCSWHSSRITTSITTVRSSASPSSTTTSWHLPDAVHDKCKSTDFKTLEFPPKYTSLFHPPRDGDGPYIGEGETTVEEEGEEEEDAEESVDDSEKAKKIIVKCREKIEKHPDGAAILHRLVSKIRKLKLGLEEQAKLLRNSIPRRRTTSSTLRRHHLRSTRRSVAATPNWEKRRCTRRSVRTVPKHSWMTLRRSTGRQNSWTIPTSNRQWSSFLPTTSRTILLPLESSGQTQYGGERHLRRVRILLLLQVRDGAQSRSQQALGGMDGDGRSRHLLLGKPSMVGTRVSRAARPRSLVGVSRSRERLIAAQRRSS